MMIIILDMYLKEVIGGKGKSTYVQFFSSTVSKHQKQFK